MNYDQWKARELDDLYDDPPEERRDEEIDEPDWEGIGEDMTDIMAERWSPRMTRADRAIESLRKPDASLTAVVNTVRQSLAEVIEDLQSEALTWKTSYEDGQRWRPIETAPQDGTHFLAWGVVIADELDEDGHVIWRGVRDEQVYVAYCPFPSLVPRKAIPVGDFVSFPWRGSVPGNLSFTHWMPLPVPPPPRPLSIGAKP